MLSRQARKRRKHLRTSYDAVSYGSQTIPVSPILRLVLTECDKLGIPFVAISGDRRAGVAERFGHSSQAALYQGFIEGRPGFLPANPPGQSSHEYRNGGAQGGPAFPRIARGAKLRPHQLGLDLASNAEATNFCNEAARHGLHFFQPYPTGTELHHICCRMGAKDLIRWLVKRGVIK